MPDTGNLASITFGTSGFTASLTSIKPGAIKRPRINTSHLSTTSASGEQYIPGDLPDYDESEIEGQYNPNDQPPFNGAAETITITFPVPSGLSTGATLAGSGFVTEFAIGALKNNELMTFSAKISWATLPTFADAS